MVQYELALVTLSSVNPDSTYAWPDVWDPLGLSLMYDVPHEPYATFSCSRWHRRRDADRMWARTVTEEIASRSDVVKLSDEDADWLYPSTTVDEVVDRFLVLGARIVALSRGARGAVLASPDARVSVEPRPARVRDTVGAGDTFMAALIASLVDGRLGGDAESLRAAGVGAAAAAAITVGRVGADLPTRAELEAELASERSLPAPVTD